MLCFALTNFVLQVPTGISYYCRGDKYCLFGYLDHQ